MVIVWLLKLCILVPDAARLVHRVHRVRAIFIAFVVKKLIPAQESGERGQFLRFYVLFSSEKVIQ